MNSEERKRLNAIKSKAAIEARFRYDEPPTWDDVHFLLAQLDSQANLDFAIIKGEMVTVSDCPECRARFPVFTVSSQLLCNDCRTATASAMRGKCVEKIKAHAELCRYGHHDARNELLDLMEQLQSLTLDQVQEKQ